MPAAMAKSIPAAMLPGKAICPQITAKEPTSIMPSRPMLKMAAFWQKTPPSAARVMGVAMRTEAEMMSFRAVIFMLLPLSSRAPWPPSAGRAAS